MLGLSFKENCPDIRNTCVVDVVKDLQEYQINVDVYDPLVNPEEVKKEYDIDIEEQPDIGANDAISIAVGYNEFKIMGTEKFVS